MVEWSRMWADTPTHTQDRNEPGHFWDRKKYGGRWWGPDERSTYVHEFGVPMDTPDPPFVPNRDRRLQDMRAHRPGTPIVDMGTTTATGHLWRTTTMSVKRHHDAAHAPLGAGHAAALAHRHQGGPVPVVETLATIATVRGPIEQQGQERRRSASPGRRNHAPPCKTGPPRTKNEKREERRLRTKALNSRRSPERAREAAADWVRTVFPPDIATAELSSEGHPICPLELRAGADDANDFGSEGEVPELPNGWKSSEAMRHADAQALEASGRVVFKRVILDVKDKIGRWAGLTISTIENAANLLRWVERTEPTAFQFMRAETVRLGSDPTILRNAGELYLLSKQNAATANYWMRSTGSPKAPPAPPVETHPVIREDVYAYLGTAILGDDETLVIIRETADESSEVLSGSHTKLAEAARAYENIPHKHWPLGFRTTAVLFPNRAHKFARVYIPDVGAWFTINALAPRRIRVGTSIELIEVPGDTVPSALNCRYFQPNRPTRPLEHYPFMCTNITASHVVGWFVQHGIARDGQAIHDLEDFARSRRCLTTGLEYPSAVSFNSGGTLRNEQDMLKMELALVCHLNTPPNQPKAWTLKTTTEAHAAPAIARMCYTGWREQGPGVLVARYAKTREPSSKTAAPCPVGEGVSLEQRLRDGNLTLTHTLTLLLLIY
ncbi:hypothetical protein C8F04DRAFT_1194344 [Mycena alexandri]|uniref:Uncharacterized protein n=1 Tax=Mycena alexandri TaxID=1745969 RepID=A0AAD6S841_9AGAR|nr:hypothetical protein C8F04DRAFT_1194344 [Mycena alexandri]